jgi:Tfp pilus assembly protein PilF
MSLLTDALSKPGPTPDDTAESAITQLEEELDITADLDASSRDPTVQTMALDELMLEEFEATRRKRDDERRAAQPTGGEEETGPDLTDTDVLSPEQVLAAQSIVLEALPDVAADESSHVLEILHEPSTVTDAAAQPDPSRIVMPDPVRQDSKAGGRPVKLIAGTLLCAIAVGAVAVYYFFLQPGEDLYAGGGLPDRAGAALAPATLSSLTPNEAVDPTVTAPVVTAPDRVGPPIDAKPEYAREPATKEDVRGFIAAAERDTQIEPVRPAKIEIARTRWENPVYVALKKAYAEFGTGNFVAAGALYQQALELDPNCIDALLGLAAIAQRNGETTEAKNFYRMALALDPKNSIAISGLMSLRNTPSSVENESELKTLLAEQPQAAHLHFALGLHYVAQSRWPDAQQAFFEAVRHDPVNADYAFNLAISLDQLRQRDTAANYYQRAIALARGAQKFDPDTARRRLSILTADN